MRKPVLTGISLPAIVLFALVVVAPAAPPRELPPIRIVYFVPGDRQPLSGYEERLDRVMTEVQRFYREGMEACGYGPLTFQLERDDKARLRFYLVQGKHPMQTYGRNASGAVRDEVKAALAPKGINIDSETVVIFQVLLKWDGDKASEIGPYCGGGDYRHGTAWVYDDERLDPKLLGSKDSGGYYGHPCSIGEFNSHYIGGVAHELGHGLGLPHDYQRTADRSRGNSLMGGGNHTYGQEKRNEGPGTFLSAASAMLLARSRPFAGDLDDASKKPDCRLGDLDARFTDGKIVLTGVVTAQPPAFGIAAFNDWARIPDDYDAVSWTCKVPNDGRFRLEVGEMRPGPSQLRLRVCHTNGATTAFAFNYTVDPKGNPDIDVLRYGIPLSEAVAAYVAGDRPRAEALAAGLKQRFPDVKDLQGKASHLQALLNPAPPRALSEVKADVASVPLSRVKFASASVGWGRPLRDQVPEQCFLQVGGQFFESGLYAHAPAQHTFDLGRAWKRLRASYGLQDGCPGSIVFVVKADGKELFRSQLVKDRVSRDVDVNVENVEQLQLVVEDGGNGNRSDWGVWLNPRLEK